MVDQSKAASPQHATLLVSRPRRGVVTVTLNQPDRGNALGQMMMSELSSVLNTAAADDQSRIVVLRGAGRHFCSGADVSERGAGGAGRIPLPDLLRTVDMFPKPMVAVVQGGCIGGGLALVACCDVALAMETAFFSVPELRLGLVPSALLPFFVRTIGYRAFRRYGLSGERIPAAEALRLGIVTSVLVSDQIEAEIETLIDALLHAAPGAVRRLKKRLAPYAAISPAEGEGIEDPDGAAEMQEGVASFREKRKPAWYIPPG